METLPASSDLLRELFNRSFEQFAHAEVKNILNGTSERNLCARWASLLESEARKAGIESYYADVEYNRKQRGQVKTILDEEMQVVAITCDLILHSRGELVSQDNLIAIEMKRIEHPAEEKQKDRLRLRALTKTSYDDIWSADGIALPEHVCGYVLGYFVELDVRRRRFCIEEYRRGDITSAIIRTF